MAYILFTMRKALMTVLLNLLNILGKLLRRANNSILFGIIYIKLYHFHSTCAKHTIRSWIKINEVSHISKEPLFLIIECQSKSVNNHNQLVNLVC